MALAAPFVVLSLVTQKKSSPSGLPASQRKSRRNVADSVVGSGCLCRRLVDLAATALGHHLSPQPSDVAQAAPRGGGRAVFAARWCEERERERDVFYAEKSVLHSEPP